MTAVTGSRAAVALVLLAGVTSTGCGAWVTAHTALHQGRYEQAATGFEKVLAGEPEHVDALTGLGVAHYTLGEAARAVAVRERAVALAPRDVTARHVPLLRVAMSHDERRGDPRWQLARLVLSHHGP